MRLCLKCVGLLRGIGIVYRGNKANFHFNYRFSKYRSIYFKASSLSTTNDTGDGTSSFYWRNTFITGQRAMADYLLEIDDLDGLSTRSFRNPHSESYNGMGRTITCYLKSDVEKRALEVWGSWKVLETEINKRRQILKEEQRRREGLSALIATLKKVKKENYRRSVEAEAFGSRDKRVAILKGSARVVIYAIFSNFAVMLFKLTAYLYTGSAAMLSEAIHSFADVVNQCLLGFGIAQSIRKPDLSHPYGFSRARYIYALISGVGIFLLGAGVTVYHGVMSLLYPPVLAFLPAAFAVLGGSLLVEGVSAVKQVQTSAKESSMTFKDYLLRGRDPTAVAVLMEDSAAVSGVLIAASCLGLAHYTGNAIYDAIGSISIGGLLGVVALFLIQRNSSALVGQSIPADRLKKLTDLLEGDLIVRSIHDVKATDLGADSVRFKAEVNFDGREVAKLHTMRLDLQKLLKEIQGYTSTSELERFLLEHGEQVIDMLGSEVDRIEMKIKKDYPEIRHVDLEIL